MAIEFLGNNGNFLEAEDNMVRPMYCNDNNVDSFQPDLAAPTTQGYSIQQELLDVSHYDDIPFDTFADDRQSFIESKEASESRYNLVISCKFMYSRIYENRVNMMKTNLYCAFFLF